MGRPPLPRDAEGSILCDVTQHGAPPYKRARTGSVATDSSSGRIFSQFTVEDASNNHILQQENQLLRQRLSDCEQSTSALKTEVAQLRYNVALLVSLNPAKEKIDDLVKTVSQVQGELSKLATLDEKSEKLASLLAALQQQMFDCPGKF